MTAANPLVALGELGQSPWYDYITRDLLTSGELERLIREDGLKGMTSNPTIFEKAITGSALYDDDIRRLMGESRAPGDIFEAIAVDDIRRACDLFHPVYEASGGVDGVVSIEVSPELARDTDGTIEEAERLWDAVARPNVMIKIPGTAEGLPAIRHCLAQGININVTLLFAVERYREVVEMYFEALEERVANGMPVDRIASVASFFVSRVDTKIDPMLDRAGDPQGLRGTIAIANAALAYADFLVAFSGERWYRLSASGARPQRPLWASTSTKDPKLPDIYYAEALVAPNTVNTLPPDTFEAYRDHGEPQVRIFEAIAAAEGRLARLAEAGVDLAQVTRELEEEGVEKFAGSFRSLVGGLESKTAALAGS
jgi:transaldolase